MLLRHTFTPYDNTRLAHLCGPIDAHLRAVEAALGVRIAHRHEQFKIDGPAARAHQALEVLQALYELAHEDISEHTVQLILAGGSGGDDALPDFHDQALDDDASESSSAATALNTRRTDLRARTPMQAVYLDHIARHDITFGIGPAGTGKTYLAVACAVDALNRAVVGRIILTRPAVEAGERLGFLPGDLSQKIDPYLRPLFDALHDLMGAAAMQKAMERGQIEIAPLAFMRGRTLNNAFVILDEAQNTTPEQMKMLLTRIGWGSKAVITGDASQVDLPRGITSGLIDAERILRRVPGIAMTRFSSADVVRHRLVARIIEAYDAAGIAQRG